MRIMMTKVKKEDGSFGDQGGVAFTSTDSGIFSPTYGRYKSPKKKTKKKTGIGRLADFLTDNSPEKKMVKDSNKALVNLLKWVTLELRKEQDPQFTQQHSGTAINDQPPRIDWRKKKDEPEQDYGDPVEFDADPDEQAAVKQNDEMKRLKRLEDGKNDTGDDPNDTGHASAAAPAGLSIQLAEDSSSNDEPVNDEGGIEKEAS